MTIQLKHLEPAYQPRLNRFLRLLLRVKNLKPLDLHLWQVMDSVAFQDTETALQTAIHNERRTRKGDRDDRT